jgi:hypothetical protein
VGTSRVLVREVAILVLLAEAEEVGVVEAAPARTRMATKERTMDFMIYFPLML